MASPPLVRFGPFRFDPTTGSLWRGAEFLPLLPKDTAVLGVLVQHAGQIVTKDALLDAVWPQTYVTDTVIKNGIGRLRRALGDDSKAPRYIQTLPRRGYRFSGTVETPEPAEDFSQSTSLAGQTAAPIPEALALMVGREPELALLQERFARALHGQRQVVFVTGEAGIGKTTVVDAFVAQLVPKDDLWLARGQCLEHHGEGEPYGPVLEALDRLCRGPHGHRWLATLRRRSGGNPLFLVTLVDYLVHQSALPADGSMAGLDRVLKALEATVPASLRQMIAAQFRQLAPAEQHALEAASVAGVEFSAAAVAAGLEEPVIPMEACCEAVAHGSNFLEPCGSTTWYDGTAAARYSFRHTLYQQVIYEGRPAGRRHHLHRQLATRLEQAYGEQVGEIATDPARHWQHGEDTEQAARYRGLAAQKANRRAAPHEAMEQVARALQLLKTLPATRECTSLELRLHLTLLPALLMMEGFASPKVARTYARAQELWRALGETVPLSPARLGLWREVYWVGPLASPMALTHGHRTGTTVP